MQIYNNNCIEALKQLPDNCIDAVVTDPPYELGFMGKKWDNTGIAYNVAMWKEVLRVLKPGGHLLSFGGTRTYHRIACAIEDAGFEIRDQLQWLYGSGFPKSMDISKAIDKNAGIWRGKAGNVISENSSMSAPNYERTSKGEPITDLAKQWNGFGTALKPANEPICLARKPLGEKTIADNVLKHGTGGINIDACRVTTTENLIRTPICRTDNRIFGKNLGCGTQNNPKGRFPSNVMLDETAAQLLDEQTGTLKSGTNCIRTKEGTFLEHEGLGKAGDVQVTYGDSGGASRFFYCAKASRKERDRGLNDHNDHPTVKPVKLMQYLVKLLTREDQTVLDPFMGSGTTGIACITTGREFVGIEMNQHYCDIAEKRIAACH